MKTKETTAIVEMADDFGRGTEWRGNFCSGGAVRLVLDEHWTPCYDSSQPIDGAAIVDHDGETYYRVSGIRIRGTVTQVETINGQMADRAPGMGHSRKMKYRIEIDAADAARLQRYESAVDAALSQKC